MDKIIIYCDGGCRGNQNKENVGGYGFTLRYKQHYREGSGGEINTTNNKMELKANIEALKCLKQFDIPVEVYVDSAYVLNGITSWIEGWKKKNWRKSDKKPVENKELWIELDNLKAKFKDIKWIKVKGHSGEDGNERADELCNLEMDKLE